MITNTAQADDRKIGITLDELAAFVQASTQLGLPGDARITVDIGWSGQVESITAAGEAR